MRCSDEEGISEGSAEIPEVAFDEAGNTGADLLNEDQPVFSLASVSLTRKEADEILTPIRTAQTNELKFTKIKRSRARRQRMAEQLAKIPTEKAVLTLFHKRFMAVAKIVDLLVEPLAHRDGLNLLDQGFNISYSNLLNICLPVYLEKDGADQLLSAFVGMVRLQTIETIDRFYGLAREQLRVSKEPFCRVLAPVVASEELIGQILAQNDRLSLDPAIPAFFQQCAIWGERFGRSFELVHDDSEPIFEDKQALQDLMSPLEEGTRIGSDRRTFRFPLQAHGIRFAASQSDPRLQVADLLAGAAAAWGASRTRGEESSPVLDVVETARLGRFVADGVWPSGAISPSELGTDSQEGTVDAITHMAEHLSRQRRR